MEREKGTRTGRARELQEPELILIEETRTSTSLRREIRDLRHQLQKKTVLKHETAVTVCEETINGCGNDLATAMSSGWLPGR